MNPIDLTCPGCDAILPEGASICPECGADLSPVLRLEMEPYLLYNQGLNLAQSGDAEGAILKLRAAVAARPDEPNAYIVLGKIYAQRGEFSQARHWWEAALRRWPDQPAARQGLQALEALEAIAKAESIHEQKRQKQQHWLSSVAYFAGGGALVLLFTLAWGSLRGQTPAPVTPPATLAVVAALTSTPSPVLPTATPPNALPSPTRTVPPPTSTVTATAIPQSSPTALPSPTPDLASLVESAILSHPRLADLEIQVEQQGSAISLQGEVPSIALKYLLEALTKGVPGVGLVDVSEVRVVYPVKSGDTLSKIALQMYGQASLWASIARANDLVNPNRIYVHQRLVIPPPE